MGEETKYIRTMLVDSKSHQYVAKLDTMGVAEYMQRMIKSEPGVPLVVLDFSPLVEMFHKKIEALNEHAESKDVRLSRSSIYNIWRQIKPSRDSAFAAVLAGNLVSKAEDTLNLIHSRLPSLISNSHSSYQESPYDAPHQRSVAFSNFVAEVDAALEILLCRVYVSAKFGFETLVDDVVVTGHCRALRKVVLDELEREVCYWQGGFNGNSPLYHACIENIGIDPNAICYLIGSDFTSEKLKDKLISEGSEAYDDFGGWQTTVLRWARCDDDKSRRIQALSKLLVRLNLLLSMLEDLHGGNFEFDADNKYKEEFQSSLDDLLR